MKVLDKTTESGTVFLSFINVSSSSMLQLTLCVESLHVKKGGAFQIVA